MMPVVPVGLFEVEVGLGLGWPPGAESVGVGTGVIDVAVRRVAELVA
jgi:hypothetical protein